MKIKVLKLKTATFREKLRLWHRRLVHIREELALWHAVRLANAAHEKDHVRHFVVPTPEGTLRVITWKEACIMRENGFFPRRMKVAQLYSYSFYWTKASRNPIHGNSLAKRYINHEDVYRWWYMTH